MNVPYRYMKSFQGTVVDNGLSSTIDLIYFVRDQNQSSSIDWQRLRQRLIQSGRMTQSPVGRLPLYAVQTRCLKNEIMEIIKDDPRGLVLCGTT